VSVSKREKYVGGERSRWWRFDRYEIQDDFIRPRAKAKLAEFDPWRAYRTRAKGHIGVPPYLELVNLVQELPRDPFGQRISVSRELKIGVRVWCRHFGLLGLLPHEVSSARFGSSMYTRTGDGWVESNYPWEPGPDEPPENEIIRETVWGDLIYEADTFWNEYFPFCQSDEHPPAVPLSTSFWKIYAEPILYFLQVARFFANAVEVIANPDHQPVVEREERRSGHNDKVIQEEEVLDLPAAIARLNHLSKSVTPIVSVDEKGGLQQHWRAPSMLGYLAMQAVQELLGDRKIIRCDACPKIFTSNHHAARHCSDLCGDRKRKQRQRKKKENEKKTARRSKRSEKG
jgi:hypothetical protein